MTKRNPGIDLMRIISMVYVIVLHILGHGGVLNSLLPESTSYKVAWFLEIQAFCAVDIFGLISGYVGFHEEDRPVKYSNYIQLWLEVVFYGVVISFVCRLWHPELVTDTDFIQMCFPVTNQLYWYFTAYTGLVLVMPLLNSALQKISERTLRKVLVVLIVSFSFYSTFFDVFTVQGGYTFLWLVILYLIGAIMKKCDIGSNIGPLKAFGWILALTLITWIWKLTGPAFEGTAVQITPDLLISYVSPTVLLSAMLYLIGASKLKFSSISAKLIQFGGSGAFAAYIINNQRFIWNYEMNQKYTWLAGVHSYLIPICVIGLATVIVIVSILIDKVRMVIFRLLHIRQLSEWIDRKARKMMEMIVQ